MTNKNFLKELELSGVKFLDKSSIYIDSNCIIGKNTIIYPNNHIKNGTIIGENCVIESNNFIDNCIIGDNNNITFSFMKDCEIANNNNIGPFSRLRSAKILNNCKIGNYVEIKKSTIHNGVKISHLTYVGDAEIFENVNIGCGVIFCNYNGNEKFKTIINKNCFIGSNCNLIAPLEIGENSFIAAGATIYKNIEKDKFVISKRELSVKEDYKKIHLRNKKN